PPRSRAATVLIVAAFVLFQATNATAMAFLTLYVSQTLGLPILWAGVTLGVAAALEVPALLIIGRLADRISHLTLVAVGAIAGIAYYLGLAAVTGPRSEEHTSELQSRFDLVCRLLLEKTKALASAYLR